MRRKIFSLCLAGVLFLSSFSYADAQSGNLKQDNATRYTQLAKKKTKKKVSSKASAISKKQFYINGELVEIEVFTKNGTTMALARDLVDPLGAVLVVQPMERKNGKKVNVAVFGKPPQAIAFVVDAKRKIAGVVTDWKVDNMIIKEAPVVATAINGRTYVPLRYTVENLGGTLSAGPSSSQSYAQPNTSDSDGKIVSLPEPKNPAPLVTGSGQTTQPVQPNKSVAPEIPNFKIQVGNLPSPITVDTSKIQKMRKSISYNGLTMQADVIEVNGDMMIGASDFQNLGLVYYFYPKGVVEYEGFVIGHIDTKRMVGFLVDFNMGFYASVNEIVEKIEDVTIISTRPDRFIWMENTMCPLKRYRKAWVFNSK